MPILLSFVVAQAVSAPEVPPPPPVMRTSSPKAPAVATPAPAPVVAPPAPPAPAPGSDLTATYKDAYGLTFSWISGSGATYRHWNDNGFGWQVAGFPYIYTGATGSGTTTQGFVNVGAQVMNKVMHLPSADLYWLVGYGLGYDLTGGNLQHGIAPGFGLDYNIGRNLTLYGAISYTLGNQVQFSTASASGSSTFDWKPGFGLGAFVHF